MEIDTTELIDLIDSLEQEYSIDCIQPTLLLEPEPKPEPVSAQIVGNQNLSPEEVKQLLELGLCLDSAGRKSIISKQLAAVKKLFFEFNKINLPSLREGSRRQALHKLYEIIARHLGLRDLVSAKKLLFHSNQNTKVRITLKVLSGLTRLVKDSSERIGFLILFDTLDEVGKIALEFRQDTEESVDDILKDLYHSEKLKEIFLQHCSDEFLLNPRTFSDVLKNCRTFGGRKRLLAWHQHRISKKIYEIFELDQNPDLEAGKKRSIFYLNYRIHKQIHDILLFETPEEASIYIGRVGFSEVEHAEAYTDLFRKIFTLETEKSTFQIYSEVDTLLTRVLEEISETVIIYEQARIDRIKYYQREFERYCDKEFEDYTTHLVPIEQVFN